MGGWEDNKSVNGTSRQEEEKKGDDRNTTGQVGAACRPGQECWGYKSNWREKKGKRAFVPKEANQ